MSDSFSQLGMDSGVPEEIANGKGYKFLRI